MDALRIGKGKTDLVHVGQRKSSCVDRLVREPQPLTYYTKAASSG